MKKDDIFQTNKVQAQLSGGKPAFEPVAVFMEGIEGSKGLIGRVPEQLSQLQLLGKPRGNTVLCQQEEPDPGAAFLSGFAWFSW